MAARFVLFTIAKTRGSEKGKAQFCWAHLKRNILGVLDFTKETAAEQFCRDALAVHASLFRLWHKSGSGLIHRPQLLNRSVRLHSERPVYISRTCGSGAKQQ